MYLFHLGYILSRDFFNGKHFKNVIKPKETSLAYEGAISFGFIESFLLTTFVYDFLGFYILIDTCGFLVEKQTSCFSVSLAKSSHYFDVAFIICSSFRVNAFENNVTFIL